MTKFLSLSSTGATLFVASCYAQSTLVPLPSPYINNTLVNFTLSDPGAADCGRSSTVKNQSATIIIRTEPRNGACLDLDFIFTHPNVTFAPTHGSYEIYEGMRYTVTSSLGNDSVGWSPGIYNYSQIFYTQRRADIDNAEDESAVGYMAVRAFADAGCPGDGDNMTASTWYSWNCQDESGKCNTLPFSVKSLYISGSGIKQGEKGCVKAAKYNGGGNRVLCVSVGGIIAVAFGIASAVML